MPVTQPKPQAVKEHPHDILLVANPDIDCDSEDSEYGYSHRDYFEVRWERYPHRIVPGSVRRMPRYLAEHFAKHLADHLLIKQEEETGKVGLMQNAKLRPETLAKIIIKVDEPHLAVESVSDGQATAQMVDKLNQETDDEPTINVGTIPNPMVGVLSNAPPQDAPTKETPVEAEGSATSAQTQDTPPPQETKAEKPEPVVEVDRDALLADAKKLGIKVTHKETVEELERKIREVA